MNYVDRAAAVAMLEDAKAAYRRAQVDPAEVDATLARLEGANHDCERTALCYARRAELLQMALDASERVAAAIYAGLYVTDDIRA